jgi:hypothetical protein
MPALKADISLNTADISLNLAKINDLSKKIIPALEADISLNIFKINDLSNNRIKNIESDISQDKADISENTTAIQDIETDISNNKYYIRHLHTYVCVCVCERERARDRREEREIEEKREKRERERESARENMCIYVSYMYKYVHTHTHTANFRVHELRVLPSAGKAAVVEIDVSLLEGAQLALFFVLFDGVQRLLGRDFELQHQKRAGQAAWRGGQRSQKAREEGERAR